MPREGHLIIQANESCNFRCRFCFIGTDHGHMLRYSSEDLRRMLLNYSDRCRSVSFAGVEPTLRPDLPDLVREAVGLGYTVDIVSNGRQYANQGYCESLIKAGVEYYFISIHGHDRSSYKETTKVDAFDGVIAGIKNMLSLGQKVTTSVVVSRQSYTYLHEFSQLMIDLGVNNALFLFYRSNARIPENDHFVLPQEKLDEILAQVERAAIYLYKSGVDPRITYLPRCLLPSCSPFIKRHVGILNERQLYPRPGDEFYPKLESGEDFQDFKPRFWKEEACQECINDPYCDGIESSMPFKPKPMKHEPFILAEGQ